MFLFIRLVLAHLIADFVLQPDEIYLAKKRGLRGAFIHYLIIFITFLFLCWPYFKFAGCWLIVAFAVVSHGIQDQIKLKFSVSPKLSFITFVLDQAIHIACLCPAFFFKFSYSAIPLTNQILDVYNNTSLAVFTGGYIVSVFAGIYFWGTFKSSYFKNPVFFENTPLFNVYVIKYGMFERFIITTAFLNMYFLAFLLVPLFFRISTKRLSFSLDSVFNFLYASLIGLFLRRYLPIW